MRALEMPELTKDQLAELAKTYRNTKDVRIRTRVQMILLAAEQCLTVPRITIVVRENAETVRRWLKRYIAQGIEGLQDRPRYGAPPKTTSVYKERVLEAVRRRPRSLGLPHSMWTLQRLADFLAEETEIIVSYETVRRLLAQTEIVFSQPQHKGSSPDPDYMAKKQLVEETRDQVKAGEVF